MPERQEFVNKKSFNLASALSSGATTLTPPSYSGYPATGTLTFICESEYIRVTDLSTHPWPITRGTQGTTAASHVLGALVEVRLTADDLGRLVGVQEEGALVSTTRDLNFVGAGVTATDVAGVATVTIPGGGGSSDMVASGASHAAGLAPDPGAVAGSTKFLREDATWAVPAGGGGGSTQWMVTCDASGSVLVDALGDPILAIIATP